MVRDTCLSPTKSYYYCSSALDLLELFIFKASKQQIVYSKHTSGTTIQSKQTSTTKNNAPIKEKLLKERTKERARFYGYTNARNAEDGTKTKLSKDYY